MIGGQLKKSSGAAAADTVLFDPLPNPELPSLERPWNTVVTGVGGTGVLTITALVAMAAHIEGKGCATLNQTGLAQKFGAVVSHVRVSEKQEDIQAVRIPAGEADLLVGCDLVVASTYEAMGKVAQDRTYAVVNAAEVPTSAFILNPDANFPSQAMKDKVATEVGEDSCHFIDSTHIATQLLGDSIASNLFLLGFAFQRGLVPVSAEALEQAIELNGVAIEFNKQAFLWGRRCAHQPEKVLSLLKPVQEVRPPQTLDQLIADREGRLVQYQNAAYAGRYSEMISRVRNADPRAEEADSLTRAAAKQLFRLMAYKDEYEVARLYGNGDFRRKLEEKFEGDFELRFHMAPPLLAKRDPESGELLKQEFGPWMETAFSWLARARFLRGTALDVFGYTAERKQERQDIADYRQLLEEIIQRLEDDNYHIAAELAGGAYKLRGYGHVKDRNREQLQQEQELLLARLRGESVEESTVRFVNAA